PPPTDAGRLDRLALDDAGAGLGIAPELDAQALAQNGVDPLPRPVEPPGANIVGDGLPRRQIVRQQTPGAAGAQGREDGVEDGTPARAPGAAARGAWAGKERTHHVPFRVAKIGEGDNLTSHTDEHIPARRTLDVLIFRRFLILSFANPV